MKDRTAIVRRLSGERVVAISPSWADANGTHATVTLLDGGKKFEIVVHGAEEITKYHDRAMHEE